MITKTILATGAVIAALAAFQPGQANAGSVHIGFGFGGPGYYPYYAYKPAPSFHRVSCGHARAIVRGHGYRVLKTRDCSGRSYSFVAKRHGKVYLVRVSSYNGHITSIRRI